jgi:hypothetical protein
MTSFLGTFTLGAAGAVSPSFDISGVTPQDWTLHMRIESLGAGKKCTVALQDSVDGFVNDIRPVLEASTEGLIEAGPTVGSQDFSLRKYQNGSARMGVMSARIRAAALSLDSGTSVQVSVWYEA